jgi:hypothetical protein
VPHPLVIIRRVCFYSSARWRKSNSVRYVGGTISKGEEFANVLQMFVDAGKREYPNSGFVCYELADCSFGIVDEFVPSVLPQILQMRY